MLKKISVADVIVGMYVHELCGSWLEHPFWRSGFAVSNSAELRRLQNSAVAEVWIDTQKGLDVPAERVSAEQSSTVADESSVASTNLDIEPVRPVSMQTEIKQALAVYQRSRQAVLTMFAEVRMGKALEMHGVDAIVDEMTQSILRHPNALISLVRLKQADEYTYMHSVAVSALMIALARQLDLDEAQVQKAGVAGLMHDIGKLLIDEKLLNKSGRLTDDEFARIRLHPVLGAQLLLDSDSEACPEIYDVCLHHHEKYDGSGYPKQLKGQQISLLARMAAVCDVYDATTSNRPYKKGWDPAVALQRMAQRYGHFDQYIFQSFVRVMGIYPVGSLLRLHSGRLAVVVEKNEQDLLKPKVKVFYSTTTHMPIVHQTIDLAAADCKDSIVARESTDDWSFRNLDKLWLE